jgi:hypothetical protein
MSAHGMVKSQSSQGSQITVNSYMQFQVDNVNGRSSMPL